MQTDLELRQAVMDELEWDPGVHAADVGVEAREGVVTLSGHVRSYSEKIAAERIAQRVSGVRALASELDVHLPASSQRIDADVAKAAAQALEWDADLPPKRIMAKVSNGLVTLSGEVDWEYQRKRAEKAVRHLRGVMGVSNQITLKQQVMRSDVTEQIRAALQRDALEEARSIEVSVEKNCVTLRGQVHSLMEKTHIEDAVWRAAGVMAVRDFIRVE